MKKAFYTIGILLSVMCAAHAQESVYPANEYKGRLFITNGTIHIGNGQVVENGTIEVNEGKIVKVQAGTIAAGTNARTIDAQGQHVYPGLILATSDLGLKEIGAGTRGSNDYLEIGEFNPNVRSIVAYNTDSKIINTLKSNGILLAGVAPQGGSISGSSSVVQLDAWNWEDAAYALDNGIHVQMPSFMVRMTRRGSIAGQTQVDPVNQAVEKVEEIKNFFRQARSFSQQAGEPLNLKLNAVKDLFTKKQKLFVHGDQVRQMLAAIDFVKEFGFDVVIVGGSESYQIAELLKQHNISVILGAQHSLPSMEDDAIDQPYKTPATLQNAGVLFALNDTDEQTRYRNLAFNAGTAVTYGLTKEQALQAITLNVAKILGISDRTGSLEAGKDANIVISTGDILDMKSSNITHAFIQGREVSLDNKQKQLYQRYKHKYGLQ